MTLNEIDLYIHTKTHSNTFIRCSALLCVFAFRSIELPCFKWFQPSCRLPFASLHLYILFMLSNISFQHLIFYFQPKSDCLNALIFIIILSEFTFISFGGAENSHFFIIFVFVLTKQSFSRCESLCVSLPNTLYNTFPLDF